MNDKLPWVLVSERLPGAVGTPVLAWGERAGFELVTLENMTRTKFMWTQCTGADWESFDLDTFSHWLPITATEHPTP